MRTPSTFATTAAQARALGRLCHAESKMRVKGVKGTPFSKCVNESHRRVRGEKGTPFSRCVVAAAKLRSEKSDSWTSDS